MPFPHSLAADVSKPSWLHCSPVGHIFVDWLFFLSRNTCALLSLQLCHFLLTQTKFREANTSLKILSVIWYDTVWEMLKPFQGSKRADWWCQGEFYSTRSWVHSSCYSLSRLVCSSPALLVTTDGPFGCLNRNMKWRGWCCVSGYGTRRAHHTIARRAWFPDKPYPIQAISSQLACSILYIWNTNMGRTVATHVNNPQYPWQRWIRVPVQVCVVQLTSVEYS